MSDLAKFSQVGLDGNPLINPIFVIPPPPGEIAPGIRVISTQPGTGTKEPNVETVIAQPVNFGFETTDSVTSNIYRTLVKPEDNILNGYASYTYNISLHMLSTKTYNTLLGSSATSTLEAFNYVPENVLVVSGGKLGFNNQISDIETATTIVQPQRHPFWQENFFFDELKIRTVIAPTQMSRGTNLVEGTMQIVEPNGFTFINRLIQTVLQVNPGTNYIFNPYMLQIDFFGMDGNTDGTTTDTKNPIKLDGLKKLFPICMTSIKTRVTSKGTVYTINFVPYSHKGLNRSVNVSPANFNISASTLEEFFSSKEISTDISAITESNNRQSTLRNLQTERNRLSPNDVDLVGDRLDADIEDWKKRVAQGVNVNGFCAAYNLFQKNLVDQNRNDKADTIEVRFDPVIGKSKLLSNASITQAQAAAILKANDIFLAQGNQGPQTINFNGANVFVPAGTIIDKLIEFTVRNSEYFLKQIEERRSIDRTKPLKWYKIIPRVELGAYSQFRKTYSTKTVFYVVPYDVYAASHPYVPNGLPTSGQVKKYDYIFTGKNTEVLDLTIDFNLLYNLSIPQNRTQENIAHGLGPAEPDPRDPYAINNPPDENNQRPPQFVATNSYIPDVAQPYNIWLHSGQTRYQTTSGDNNTLNKQDLAASVLHSINLDSRGDMINVKLKILGDPDFIKQDDVFYNSAFFKNKGVKISNSGGSLWMDTANVTIQLNINSPVDYDDTFGLAIPGKDNYGGIFSYNAFSGIYKVIAIENTFYKGRFEQVLDIVRAPIQNVQQLLGVDNAQLQQRQEMEKALQLAKNVNTNRAASLLNVPLRSTAGSLTRLSTALYGQQAAVNTALTSVASLNNVVGGLKSVAMLPAILATVGTRVLTQSLSGAISKGITTVGKTVVDTFTSPDLGWMDKVSAGQEAAAGLGDLDLGGSAADFVSDLNILGF